MPATKALAAKYGLAMTMMQPFGQFDAWAPGSRREKWARLRAGRWLPLCSMLDIDIIQVGTSDKVEADAGDAKIAQDLRWIADLGAAQNPPVRIAYEVWCFNPYVNDWEHTWKIVKEAVSMGRGRALTDVR